MPAGIRAPSGARHPGERQIHMLRRVLTVATIERAPGAVHDGGAHPGCWATEQADSGSTDTAQALSGSRPYVAQDSVAGTSARLTRVVCSSGPLPRGTQHTTRSVLVEPAGHLGRGPRAGDVQVAVVLAPTARARACRPGTSGRRRTGAAPRRARSGPAARHSGMPSRRSPTTCGPQRLAWSRRRCGSRRRCSRGRRRAPPLRWPRCPCSTRRSGTGSTSSHTIGVCRPARFIVARLNFACW